MEKVKFPKDSKISSECKDFIKSLLNKNPLQRLGSKADTLEIMNHCFFKQFNWFKLLSKKLTSPYLPFS